MDVEKRAKLLNEINASLIRGNGDSTVDKMLIDLNNNEKILI
ncbi:MAG TPA: hypothetical protein VIP70_05750 [Nitrososphaeraceae archaeon]